MAIGITALAAALLLVVAFFIRLPTPQTGAPKWQRWLARCLPLCGAIMLIMTWTSVAVSPYEAWNGARTAPAVAWARGMPLYYPRGEGPATDFIYGPVAAIMRLPAAWMRSPTSAIILADLINAAIFFLPAVLFLIALRGEKLLTAAGILLFWGFSLVTPSLVYSAFYVHADAPAVGFAMLGCIFLIRLQRGNGFLIKLALASLCAVLATASKQNLAPIIVVFPLYVLAAFDLKRAAVLSGIEIAMLAAAAIICRSAFGADALIYRLITIPSHHPWVLSDHGKFWSLVGVSGDLMHDVLIPLCVLVFLLLFCSRDSSLQARDLRTWRPWVLENSWILLLAIAVIMIPSALVGKAKVGGNDNALTPTSYFLVAALSAWMTRFTPSLLETWDHLRPRIVVGVASILSAALALACITPFPRLIDRYVQLALLDSNPQQIAFEFSRKHPGEAYFPWYPLATLLAEGKYYHFDYGLVSLYLAHDLPTDEQLKAYLPPSMKYVIFSLTSGEAPDALQLLRDYKKRVDTPDLAFDWAVFARDPVATAEKSDRAKIASITL